MAAKPKMKPMKAGGSQLVQLDELRSLGPPAEMIFGEWYPALRRTR
jgi:hypothetical protein